MSFSRKQERDERAGRTERPLAHPPDDKKSPPGGPAGHLGEGWKNRYLPFTFTLKGLVT